MIKTFSLQQAFFKSDQTLSYEYRLQALIKLESVIKSHLQQISTALYLDLEKSSFESYMCEIGLVLNSINYAKKNLKKWMKVKKVKTPITLYKAKSYRFYQPYGVTLIIAPWNYPLLLTIDPLIGAIASGNTVIIKPSEYAAQTTKLLASLLNNTFDENYIHVFEGGVEESRQLLELPFNFIFFTGSTRVGSIVAQAAAKHLTPVCLELGGKSPCIVCEDTNLDLAAKRIVFGKYLNAGQTCVAPDYCLVNSNVKDEFIKYVIKYINQFYPMDQFLKGDMTSIITMEHLDRLVRLIDNTNVLIGGNIFGRKLYPTVIDGVNWSDEIMKEEIFGPILPIITYSDFEEIIAKLKTLESPLALYLFTDDMEKIEQVTTKISFGGGCINDTIMHLANHHLSFGGVGSSGLGRYHGYDSFTIFSYEKSILSRSTKVDLQLRYPPYNSKKQSIIERFLR